MAIHGCRRRLAAWQVNATQNLSRAFGGGFLVDAGVFFHPSLYRGDPGQPWLATSPPAPLAWTGAPPGCPCVTELSGGFLTSQLKFSDPRCLTLGSISLRRYHPGACLLWYSLLRWPSVLNWATSICPRLVTLQRNIRSILRFTGLPGGVKPPYPRSSAAQGAFRFSNGHFVGRCGGFDYDSAWYYIDRTLF